MGCNKFYSEKVWFRIENKQVEHKNRCIKARKPKRSKRIVWKRKDYHQMCTKYEILSNLEWLKLQIESDNNNLKKKLNSVKKSLNETFETTKCK